MFSHQTIKEVSINASCSMQCFYLKLIYRNLYARSQTTLPQVLVWWIMVTLPHG